MFPYSPAVSPAVNAHLDTQLAFFTDLSRSFTDSFQRVCAANLMLSQTLFQNAMSGSQRLLYTREPDDVTGAADSRAGLREETLKNYRDPFQPKGAHGDAGPAQAETGVHGVHETVREAAGASMQFEGLEGNGAAHGKVQGQPQEPAQQSTQHAGNKHARKPG